MYYRDNSQDYKEEINTESYDEHDDEYEDFFNYHCNNNGGFTI